MGKSCSIVLMCLLTAAILFACNPSPVELDVKPSHTVTDIQITKTKQDLSLSPTPTFTSLPTSISPTPISQPSDIELGQIKGVLVDKNSGHLLLERPILFHVILVNENEAEMQELLNKVELEVDKQGWFLFKGVPPGMYSILAGKNVMVTPAFFVEPGQIVDLGKIEVPK
jgi:hypothetical protein